MQGFPEDWIVEGSKAQRYKQIGNAVPAVMGESMGQVIMSHLKNFSVEPPIRLGLPNSFSGYIEYSKKDHARNQEARTVHHPFEL